MHNLYTMLNMLLNIIQKIQNDKSAREDQNAAYSSVKSIKFTLMEKYILYTLFREICYWLAHCAHPHLCREENSDNTTDIWGPMIIFGYRGKIVTIVCQRSKAKVHTLLGMMLKDDKSWYMYLNLQVTYKRRINSY